MTRKAPRDGTVPPTCNDQSSAPPPARRDRRNTDDLVSLGLRKLWEKVEQEPVPDAFLTLLDAIDTARSVAAADDKPGPASDDPAKTGDS